MAEEWRPVVGFEEHYEVSSIGRVRRIGGGRGARVGRVLRHSTLRGYFNINLYVARKEFSRRVHRLVAEAFIGECPLDERTGRLCDVNHKNGNRSDNRVENLEWSTRSANLSHAYHVLGTIHPPETKLRGEDCGQAKLTREQVLAIRDLARIREAGLVRIKNTEIAAMYGVDNSHVGKIIKGATWAWL